jgi:outer membrane protein W
MRTRLFSVVSVTVLFILILGGSLFANEWPRTGIGFRFNHWNVKDQSVIVRVSDNYTTTETGTGGYGGSLYFFSRIARRLYIDFTVGAIGTVEQRTIHWDHEEVKADAVVPFLFGVRYDILPSNVQSVLQPYAAAGFGTYWINDVYVEEQAYHDSHDYVSVNSKARPGGYVGAGMNFMLSNRVAINYDMRYHMVDFQNSDFHNGIEFGFGCSLMWGK